MPGPVYFRSDGAWAFEFFGCLLASWWPIAHPAAAPSLPCPAMCPATPPTMAPLMHPLASALEIDAIAVLATKATVSSHFMIILRFLIGEQFEAYFRVP